MTLTFRFGLTYLAFPARSAGKACGCGKKEEDGQWFSTSVVAGSGDN
ncbi:unnamed protein product [Ciceribacter selenitireducens ATCC BAA-1503]|uniref:Uncharacterized protein n=1 Tax=Ciceribacter selenitireducens ATCC BAA-1503 TaxID=1336235 RepID=A0A376AK75_9HYPH|nr:unnamed protein product [Ciceribacter selenitireducens ATCC BAA-1503]